MLNVAYVLTDISMPGLSGLELLGHVRQRYAHTPVIIITGIGDEEHTQGPIKIGAFDVLLKPFTLEAVEKGVKRAVEYRRWLLEESYSEKRMGDGDDKTNQAYDWKILDKETI